MSLVGSARASLSYLLLPLTVFAFVAGASDPQPTVVVEPVTIGVPSAPDFLDPISVIRSAGRQPVDATASGAIVSLLVPVVLKSNGLNNSYFTTELTITNRGATANLEFVYTAAFGGGSGTARDTLEAMIARRIPDAIEYLRSIGIPIPHKGDRGGTLLIRAYDIWSPGDIVVMARTTTPVPEGRAGLAYWGSDTLGLPRPRVIPDTGPLATGPFLPTNYDMGDPFPTPAPEPAPSSSFSLFEGDDPNGDWNLFVADDSTADKGSIGGGWCLELRTTRDRRTFCNQSPIAVPATGPGATTGAPASPYPSTIHVTSVLGTIIGAGVTLKGVNHGYPDDLDVLLAGPSGKALVLLSDAGGTYDAIDLDIAFDEDFSTSVICGLRQNAADRSNVGVVNAGGPEDGAIGLQVTVISGDPGKPYSQTLPTLVLEPGGFHQYSGLLGEHGLTNGLVTIQKTSGKAPYFAYGVINDQRNSDGSFIAAQPTMANLGKKKLILPVIVESSPYSSEVVLTNFSDITKTVSLAFVADAIDAPDDTATWTTALRPNEQLIVPDFVDDLRKKKVSGLGPAGPLFAGGLFLTTTATDVSGLFLGARTSSPGGGGRYGLFYTAVPNGEGFSYDARVYGLIQDGENRTNLAFLNTGEWGGSTNTTDVFDVDIYDATTGSLVTFLQGIPVPATKWLQRYAKDTKEAYADIRKVQGANPFLAYAVINDGPSKGVRSDDGAFVAAQPYCLYSIPPFATAGWSGGPGGFYVTTGAEGCPWIAKSNASWIHLTSNTSGSATGLVSWKLDENTFQAPRSGTVTAVGKTMDVTQLGNAPGTYDGTWKGKTTQDKPVSLRIEKNEVMEFAIDIDVTLLSCRATGTIARTFWPRPAVADSSFFQGSFSTEVGSAHVSVGFSGFFQSSTELNGSVSLNRITTSSYDCIVVGGGSGPGPGWSATKQ
jgi:hypothetical protein